MKKEQQCWIDGWKERVMDGRLEELRPSSTFTSVLHQSAYSALLWSCGLDSTKTCLGIFVSACAVNSHITKDNIPPTPFSLPYLYSCPSLCPCLCLGLSPCLFPCPGRGPCAGSGRALCCGCGSFCGCGSPAGCDCRSYCETAGGENET